MGHIGSGLHVIPGINSSSSNSIETSNIMGQGGKVAVQVSTNTCVIKILYMDSSKKTESLKAQ